MIFLDTTLVPRLNPDVVIIGTSFPWNPEEFTKTCRKLGIDIRAIKEGRIIKVPKNLENIAKLPELALFLVRALHPEHKEKLEHLLEDLGSTPAD